jgi:hypothetical protein
LCALVMRSPPTSMVAHLCTHQQRGARSSLNIRNARRPVMHDVRHDLHLLSCIQPNCANLKRSRACTSRTALRLRPQLVTARRRTTCTCWITPGCTPTSLQPRWAVEESSLLESPPLTPRQAAERSSWAWSSKRRPRWSTSAPRGAQSPDESHHQCVTNFWFVISMCTFSI